MQLGMIGLGRMGANMVRRLMKAGHECVVFDMTPASVQALQYDVGRKIGQLGRRKDDTCGISVGRIIIQVIVSVIVDVRTLARRQVPAQAWASYRAVGWLMLHVCSPETVSSS